jgi:hypothetical protein
MILLGASSFTRADGFKTSLRRRPFIRATLVVGHLPDDAWAVSHGGTSDAASFERLPPAENGDIGRMELEGVGDSDYFRRL